MAEINGMEFNQPIMAQQARGSKETVAKELNHGAKVKKTKEDFDNTHVIVRHKDGSSTMSSINDGKKVIVKIDEVEGKTRILDQDNNTLTIIDAEGNVTVKDVPPGCLPTDVLSI